MEQLHGVTRRGFLSGTLGATLAAASLAGEKPEKKWEMKLSTSSIHYLHLPIEQACQRIAKLGYQGVDIWSGFAGCPHLDDVAKRLGPDGLKKMLADCGLELFSFSVYRGGYRRYAKLLGKAGGGVAVRGSTRAAKPAELVPRMKKFIDGLKPLVELAEEEKSYLAIENHGHALLDSIDSFKAFVDLNAHPRVGIALAPYHLQAYKTPVEDVIKIAAPQCLFFYAWQRSPGLAQLPGVGPADFTPWIRALARANYPHYLSLFMHGHPPADKMATAVAKSRQYMLKCLAKVRQRAHADR